MRSGSFGKMVNYITVAVHLTWRLGSMVDVQPLGQNGTNIGFATFNCWFHRLTDVNIVSNILQRASIQKDDRIWGMCMLRHNAASMMVQNSIPLATIAAILGHSETRATDIYITTDVNKLKECVLPLVGISRKVNP